MIFIGNGSLLKSAISYVLKQEEYKIDYVFTQTNSIAKYCDLNKIPCKDTNVNNELSLFQSKCSDKIVFSINNNEQIIKKTLLSLGLKFYNIHNGIVPQYRGYPVSCVVYAILNGENKYGVSLHEIDEGIDTGKCIAQKIFSIESTDNFETVMNKGIKFCDEIFKDNFENLMKGNIKPLNYDKLTSNIYTKNSLEKLYEHKTNPRIKAATYFGIYNLWFGELNKIIKQAIQ